MTASEEGAPSQNRARWVSSSVSLQLGNTYGGCVNGVMGGLTPLFLRLQHGLHPLLNGGLDEESVDERRPANTEPAGSESPVVGLLTHFMFSSMGYNKPLLREGGTAPLKSFCPDSTVHTIELEETVSVLSD